MNALAVPRRARRVTTWIAPLTLAALFAPTTFVARAHAQATAPAGGASVTPAPTASAPTTPSTTSTDAIPAPSPGAAAVAPVAPASVPPPVYVDPMPGTPPKTGGTTSAPSGGLELSTLRVLLAKGVISEKEYESIVKDAEGSTGAHALDANAVVLGKWTTTLYGFVEADSIYDSTQSFNDSAGNGIVNRSTSYNGDNGRTQFGARNSRIGFRTSAPEMNGIRASAQLEMDFLGDRAAPGDPSAVGTDTEAQYFTNPLFRIRHMNVKLETPVVNVLLGQYWDLFGWQSVYHPNTVEIQGVPGQIYSRTPQVRLWKTLQASDVVFEIAVAAMRPVQRDSAIPELQGGLRLAYNGWKGVTTAGATGTSAQPLSIAVTGDWRKIKLRNLNDGTTDSESATGTAIAVDAFIPIIPADKRRGNALSVTAEFATGKGDADLYTGLNGGVPYLTAPKNAAGTAIYEPNLDRGIAVLNADGSISLVEWRSMIFGVQYYFPGVDGKVWISGNYSYTKSPNMGAIALSAGNPAIDASKTALRDHETWWDVNAFADVTDAVRLGLEFAQFKDSFVSGADAKNNRLQFSAFYIF